MADNRVLANPLTVPCPYCTNPIDLPEPADVDMTQLVDIHAVPYTRDIGRFDPPNQSEWFSPDGWSRIGKDFMRFLSWEKIGVLRVTEKGINVQYRVQGCPKCGELFDVYANFTGSGKKLPDLWPHLFARDPHRENDYTPYRGISFFLWLTALHKSPVLSGAIVGLAALLFVSAPWIFPGSPIWSNQLMLETLLPSLINLSILYMAAVIGVFAIALMGRKFISYLDSTDEFHKLFKANPEKGITHWLNYTRSRFVGVQLERKRIPGPSQGEIISGLLALGLMLVMWFALGSTDRFASAWTAALTLFNLVFWLFVAYVMAVGAWLAFNTTQYVLAGAQKMPMRLSPYDQYTNARPLHVLQTYTLWTMTTIFLAVVVMIAILNSFSTQSFVRDLHYNLAFSPFQTVFDLKWLVEWLTWVLAVIFFAMSIGTQRFAFLAILALYVGFEMLVDPATALSLELAGISLGINLKVLGVGIFFTLLLLDHILTTDRTVRHILLNARDRELEWLEARIQEVRMALTERSSGQEMPVPQTAWIITLPWFKSWQFELRKSHPPEEEPTRAGVLLEQLNQYTQLHERVKSARIGPKLITQITQAIPPFITSLIVPAFLEGLLGMVLDQLVEFSL